MLPLFVILFNRKVGDIPSYASHRTPPIVRLLSYTSHHPPLIVHLPSYTSHPGVMDFKTINIYMFSLIRRPMLLVKLGGSVITDKGEYATFRRENTLRLARELKTGLANGHYDRCILVHGAGSFGHILAHDNRIHLGLSGSRDHLKAVPCIRRDVRTLNSQVSDALAEAGFSPISVPPEVVLHKKGPGRFAPIAEGLKSISSHLECGFMPILFGDVVADDEKGFSICSGDDVMNVLSRMPGVRRIVFLTDVDGVFETGESGFGGLIERCTPHELPELASGEAGSKHRDVTGSMAGKIKRIAEMAALAEVWVVNGNVPGLLASLAAGGVSGGTLIRKDHYERK